MGVSERHILVRGRIAEDRNGVIWIKVELEEKYGNIKKR